MRQYVACPKQLHGTANHRRWFESLKYYQMYAILTRNDITMQIL